MFEFTDKVKFTVLTLFGESLASPKFHDNEMYWFASSGIQLFVSIDPEISVDPVFFT